MIPVGTLPLIRDLAPGYGYNFDEHENNRKSYQNIYSLKLTCCNIHIEFIGGGGGGGGGGLLFFHVEKYKNIPSLACNTNANWN